jgi:hypothetical protein
MAQGPLRGQVMTLSELWCRRQQEESATLLKHTESINCDTREKVRHYEV